MPDNLFFFFKHFLLIEIPRGIDLRPQECDTQDKFRLFSTEVALKSGQCVALP